MDRSFQLVLDCLDTEQVPISLGTLVAFRKLLIEAHMDRRLIERTIKIADQSQAFGPRALRAALDSSPMWGAGRVEDTYNLVGHALKKVMRVVADRASAGADGSCVGGWGGIGLRDKPEGSTGSGLGSTDSRCDEALTLVLQVLQIVGVWVQTLTEPEEKATAQPILEIAEQVQEQDVQIDEKGKASLIKGGAFDRRISIEDSEMRHGRKSRSVRVDGYKRHVLHDLDTGLIRAVGVTPANVPETSVTEAISADLERQKVSLKELHNRGLRRNLFDLRRCAVVHNLHVLARSQLLQTDLQDAA